MYLNANQPCLDAAHPGSRLFTEPCEKAEGEAINSKKQLDLSWSSWLEPSQNVFLTKALLFQQNPTPTWHLCHDSEMTWLIPMNAQECQLEEHSAAHWHQTCFCTYSYSRCFYINPSIQDSDHSPPWRTRGRTSQSSLLQLLWPHPRCKSAREPPEHTAYCNMHPRPCDASGKASWWRRQVCGMSCETQKSEAATVTIKYKLLSYWPLDSLDSLVLCLKRQELSFSECSPLASDPSSSCWASFRFTNKKFAGIIPRKPMMRTTWRTDNFLAQVSRK